MEIIFTIKTKNNEIIGQLPIHWGLKPLPRTQERILPGGLFKNVQLKHGDTTIDLHPMKFVVEEVSWDVHDGEVISRIQVREK